MTQGRPRLVHALALVAFAFAAWWVGRGAFRSAAPGLREEHEATAVPSRTDRVAEIVLVAANGRLRPNVIYSAAGQPLRIVVRAAAGGGGPDRLVVPELGIAADVAPAGDTVVAVPETRRGAFRIDDGGGKAIGALRFQ